MDKLPESNSLINAFENLGLEEIDPNISTNSIDFSAITAYLHR